MAKKASKFYNPGKIWIIGWNITHDRNLNKHENHTNYVFENVGDASAIIVTILHMSRDDKGIDPECKN